MVKILRGSAWFLLTGILAFVTTASGADPEDRPKLAVLVIFDQLRGDFLMKWEPLFGDRGFRRLMRDGAWFRNCHYPYAGTFTAPGHASIMTGCSPNEHGIIANEWYDRTIRSEVGCVAVERYQRVPSLPVAKKSRLAGEAAPDRLLAPSLGDVLKDGTGGKARIVSLSMKDRSAVLPAGHHADACYWFDSETATFVTSSFYVQQPHRWMTEFNDRRPADRWSGKYWERFRPELDYNRYSGPDEVAGEGLGAGQGRTFPHPMNGTASKPDKEYYKAVYNSPFGNELLLDLVKQAVAAENLGRGTAPDLLCVSFSSNDAIGHCWGPDSQEVLDVTLRSDRIVEELLACLDDKVGPGRYVLVLTADHGICPLPEVARAQGKEASRVAPAVLLRDADAILDRAFGKPQRKQRWLEAFSNDWFYLNRSLLRELDLPENKVADALAGWLRKQPGVMAAYTRTELMQPPIPGDPIGNAVRLSFHAGRSGDVAFVLKPYHLPAPVLSTGTTHGSPHNYDTHVPLLVYGTGIQSGVHEEAVTPLATAAILARALRIEPPAKARAPVPDRLFATP